MHLKIDEHDRGFNAREPPAILSYEPKGISKMLLVSEPDEFGPILSILTLKSLSYLFACLILHFSVFSTYYKDIVFFVPLLFHL